MRGLPSFLHGSNLSLLLAVGAHASGLHSLGSPLADAELRFSLHQAARPGESVAIECFYRPVRERDVHKERNFHLLNPVGRAGSRDLLTVQREEFHSTVIVAQAKAGVLSFTVPLRDPDAGHRDYQLERVRVDRLIFERWFKEVPALDPGFGLQCSADRLMGTVNPNGLGASPLTGVLPLWPTLRTIDLTLVTDTRPVIRLWDPLNKPYWDGWRQSTPRAWSGGRSIVTRHKSGPTIWWSHDYFKYWPAGESPLARPMPPAGALAGASLEIFWPEGETLEFPEVYFERPVATIALRVAALTNRALSLLAKSVELCPGIEPGSLSVAEWNELDALASSTEVPDPPASLGMKKAADGKDILQITRHQLAEPWIYLFGTEYDSDRRFAVTALVLNPSSWTGPIPPDLVP